MFSKLRGSSLLRGLSLHKQPTHRTYLAITKHDALFNHPRFYILVNDKLIDTTYIDSTSKEIVNATLPLLDSQAYIHFVGPGKLIPNFNYLFKYKLETLEAYVKYVNQLNPNENNTDAHTLEQFKLLTPDERAQLRNHQESSNISYNP